MTGPGADAELRLVLARHGQTASNVARVLDTALPGPGLTDLGRAQAAALGGELAAGPPVRALYHSAARRARETASLVAGPSGLEPVVLDGLHEVQVGDLEGRDDEEAVEAFRRVVGRWQEGRTDVGFPGGESADDVLARYRHGLEEVRGRHPDGGTVVVVGHGAALRMVGRFLVEGVGVPDGETDHLDNCGRITLSTTPHGWALESWSGAAPGGRSSHDVTGG